MKKQQWLKWPLAKLLQQGISDQQPQQLQPWSSVSKNSLGSLLETSYESDAVDALARGWQHFWHLHFGQTTNTLKVFPTSTWYHSWSKKRQETKWDVEKWGISIGVTFPTLEFADEGRKVCRGMWRRNVFCRKSNSSDRLSFQHYNQSDSAAVGISLNMINVGVCWQNVFRPLHYTTHKTNVLTYVVLTVFNESKKKTF